MIPEVEKGEAAVDAVERDPSAEPDATADVGGAELAAEVGSRDPLEGGFR